MFKNSTFFEQVSEKIYGSSFNIVTDINESSECLFDKCLNQTELIFKLKNFSRSDTDEQWFNETDFISKLRAHYPVDDWLNLGFLTKEYLEKINKHWFQYDPPSKRQHYLMASIYFVLMLCGVTGNIVVIFLFFRCRSLRTPTNLLVFNLALSDLCMISKAPIFIYNSLHFGPALGQIGCSVYGLVGGLTGVVSILSLSVIALDRYYAIAYPLSPSSRTTWKRSVRWISTLWIYSICLAAAPFTGIAGPYVPEGYLTSCSFNYLEQDQKTFILVFFTLAWIVPFLVIVCCYGGICRAVVGVGPSRVGQEKEKRKTEIRLALVVILVVAVWFISWTPYAVVALIGVTGYGQYLTPTASMLPALFCKTASCVDPFIYAFTHPRFRRELFRLACRKEYETKRQATALRSTVWRTDSLNKKLRVREGDEDIEEMVVAVERQYVGRPRIETKSNSVESYDTIATINTLSNPEFKPPSWYVPPKPHNKSSSFKIKSLDSVTSISDD